MRGAVAVTGASGFIGRALVARLAADGREVIALTRADVDQGESHLRSRVEGAYCIVHLAARAHRGGTAAEFEADVALARSLARMAAQQGVLRFVQISSIGVHGTSTHGAPFTEAGVPAPTEPYSHAKLRAEQAVQAELASSATEGVILRPSMVYGPHAPGNFARLLDAVRKGWPLPFASVRNRRFLLGIDNLLDAVWLCMDHPAAAHQTFVVADADAVSTPGLVSLIAQGLGVPARLFPFPPSLLGAAAHVLGRGRMAESLLGDLEVDCGHLQRSLGWQARVPAPEGIVRAASTSRQ